MKARQKKHADYPKYRDGSIDAGIYALHACRKEIVKVDGKRIERTAPLQLEAIAYVCGCSEEWMRQLEARALGRLLRGLRHEMSALTEEETEELRQQILEILDGQSRGEHGYNVGRIDR